MPKVEEVQLLNASGGVLPYAEYSTTCGRSVYTFEGFHLRHRQYFPFLLSEKSVLSRLSGIRQKGVMIVNNLADQYFSK